MAGKKILRNTNVNERVYNKEYVNYLESLIVKLSDNQTISGIKTFGSSPIVPMPTQPAEVANKEYADSILGSFATPDYARMESINRITAPDGTWTVDKNGFVMLHGDFTTTTAASLFFNYSINDKVVLTEGNSNTTRVAMRKVFAVKAGDVVKATLYYSGTTLSSSTVGCFFIPVISNNFNVYPDKGTPVANSNPANNVTLPVAQWVDFYTCPNDGVYSVSLRAKSAGDFYIGIKASSSYFILKSGHVEAADLFNASFPLSKGTVLALHAGAAQSFNASEINIAYLPNHVSIANAASAWVNVPLTLESILTGTVRCKYNASLGMYYFSFEGANLSTPITSNQQIASWPTSFPPAQLMRNTLYTTPQLSGVTPTSGGAHQVFVANNYMAATVRAANNNITNIWSNFLAPVMQ